MSESLADIRSANSLIGAALHYYLTACSAFDTQTYPLSKSLSHLIDNELLALESYENMIRQAKSTLGRAKNHSSTIVPINSLPAEILSRIFTLAMDETCRGYEHAGKLKKLSFPKYPDTFLHVCSRWRQIATRSCMLWSHIDIIPRYAPTTMLLERAETLVALAGQCPLELHISGAEDPESDLRDLSADDLLFQFLSSIAPRLQSLELVTHLFTDLHLQILETCFVGCTPGTLTRLIVQVPNDPRLSSESKLGFLETTPENGSEGPGLMIDMPQQDLEELWLPIQTLYLCGIYPHWSGNAYHGLVELRLVAANAGSGISTITEAELVGILGASPHLRILHLGMVIDEPSPKNASITPVRLNVLEVLDLSTTPFAQNGTVLRWIAPGPKPLIVTLNLHSFEMHLSDDEIKQFFARSHTTKLAIVGPYSNHWPPELLSLSPSLQFLAFKNLTWRVSLDTIPFPEALELQPVCSRPNYLQLVFCLSIVDLGWLRQVVERYPIKMITFWASDARHNGGIISHQELEYELSQICPEIRIIDYSQSSPIKDWCLFD